MNRWLLGIVLTLPFASAPTLVAQTITLTQVTSGFDRPVFAMSAPGDPDRLFVTEQHSGQVKILDIETGAINPQPFLTVNGGDISTRNEQGLLGLAFHPNYATNGRLFVNYTNAGGDTVIEEYQRDTTDSATGTGTAVLSIAQPQSNHNGGWIGFGPSGLLHVATGDGGGSNDSGHGPIGNSQDTTNNLLGKILRIDVNGDDFSSDPNRNYAIPLSNPFVGGTGDGEILAYGLRNPYRSSFDRETGDLFIADVGQNAREEIDVIPAGTVGQNFGWRVREGLIDGPFDDPVPNNLVDPIHDYDHSSTGGFSVTGGYVYRGPIRALQGKYFYADFVSDNLWSLEYDGTTATDVTVLNDEISVDIGSLNDVSSFAEDDAGNLYVIELGGTIYRFGFDLPGDLNGDGNVDAADIDLYADVLGQPANGELAALDLDNDGFVTLDDHQQLIETRVQTTDGEFGTILGDINFDGTVDVLSDAAALVNSLGSQGNTIGYANGDLNADRRVDVLGDAAILVDNLGRVNGAAITASAAAVPEPAGGSMIVALLAATGLVGRRHRRHTCG